MPTVEIERRSFRRYASKAHATVYRAHDLMRFGLRGSVRDLSTHGVTLVLATPFDVGEPITGQIENPVLRASVKMRGRVENIQVLADGSHRLGCSLATRFTVRESHDLKLNQAEGWVGWSRRQVP